MFDLDFFQQNPLPFYTLAKELLKTSAKPTKTHKFIKLLDQKGQFSLIPVVCLIIYIIGLLLRCYTQNIDGLELVAGISPSKLVEAHGSFSTASCIKCKASVDKQVMNDGMSQP